MFYLLLIAGDTEMEFASEIGLEIDPFVGASGMVANFLSIAVGNAISLNSLQH